MAGDSLVLMLSQDVEHEHRGRIAFWRYAGTKEGRGYARANNAISPRNQRRAGGKKHKRELVVRHRAFHVVDRLVNESQVVSRATSSAAHRKNVIKHGVGPWGQRSAGYRAPAALFLPNLVQRDGKLPAVKSWLLRNRSISSYAGSVRGVPADPVVEAHGAAPRHRIFAFHSGRANAALATGALAQASKQRAAAFSSLLSLFLGQRGALFHEVHLRNDICAFLAGRQ